MNILQKECKMSICYYCKKEIHIDKDLSYWPCTTAIWNQEENKYDIYNICERCSNNNEEIILTTMEGYEILEQ